jgi:hypothetical protein
MLQQLADCSKSMSNMIEQLLIMAVRAASIPLITHRVCRDGGGSLIALL